MAGTAHTAHAQRIGLKTNALYWAAASPNIGAEFRVNRHVTLDVEGVFNRLDRGKLDTRFTVFTPEARYWFSARPQAGHFVGLMGAVASYDLGIDRKRYIGDVFGGGLTYGYSFVLSRHWSLEATVGGGYAHVRQKRFDKGQPEPESYDDNKWTWAPLKAGLSFVYIIR